MSDFSLGKPILLAEELFLAHYLNIHIIFNFNLGSRDTLGELKDLLKKTVSQLNDEDSSKKENRGPYGFTWRRSEQGPHHLPWKRNEGIYFPGNACS